MAEAWDINVQRMIDFIERNLRQDLRLVQVAERLGYSPYYCTRQFRRVVGMSLRRYLGLRRLSLAAEALRDSKRGILEIALDCGFASQEALTRAFAREWRCTPGGWRRRPEVICLLTRRGAVFPQDPPEEADMSVAIKKIHQSFQTVPARRFIGLRIEGASDYLDFWEKAGARGIDCHAVEGQLASLSANAQVGAWYGRGAAQGYLYGVELPADYRGPVPEGMENTLIPSAEYAVFHHPPYDFETQDGAVWRALKAALAAWDPAAHGREWDEDLPTWQRHDPENMGQAWAKPLKKVKR